MTRAVFDSTVLVSAFLVKSGPANELLHQAEAGAFTVCLCPAILEETSRVLLDDPRIRKRYYYPDEAATQYVQLLALWLRSALIFL